MFAPSAADVIFVLLNEAKDLTDFPSRKAGLLGQFDFRFKPELGLAVLPAKRSRTGSRPREKWLDSWAK
jgi:hypothetical protein